MSISIDPTFRESMDRIKAKLGKGEVVCGPRQTGKTTALLEYIHEKMPLSSSIIVVTCNIMEARRLMRVYKELYPGDGQPIVKSLAWVKNTDVVGTAHCWVTDEVWPTSVVENAPDYECCTYLGGVGNPMCMDLHSN